MGCLLAFISIISPSRIIQSGLFAPAYFKALSFKEIKAIEFLKFIQNLVFYLFSLVQKLI